MTFFRFISRFPFGILYGISNILYFILFYIVRYRRHVILQNLCFSFPEKSPDQIKTIAKHFYRNLTDILVETIKMPDLSRNELMKRVFFANSELIIERLYAGQSAVIMAPHQGNWEWLPSAAVLYGMPTDSIYKPLSNPFFEKLMKSVRASFGAIPVPMQNLPRRMATERNNPRLIALAADQAPNVPEQAYWIDFLHRDTPFYSGSERLARSQNLPVFYVELVRFRRGYYKAMFTLITEPPYDTLPPGAIVERYRDLLEETIRAYPSDWLWSHKRWKHWRGKYPKVGAKLK